MSAVNSSLINEFHLWIRLHSIFLIHVIWFCLILRIVIHLHWWSIPSIAPRILLLLILLLNLIMIPISVAITISIAHSLTWRTIAMIFFRHWHLIGSWSDWTTFLISLWWILRFSLHWWWLWCILGILYLLHQSLAKSLYRIQNECIFIWILFGSVWSLHNLIY